MKATSFRLPDSTDDQLRQLMLKLDMTRTQVLIVALDRLYRDPLQASIVRGLTLCEAPSV